MGLARPHQEPDAPPQTHRLLKFRRLSSGARLGPEAQPGPATCPRRDAGCAELAGPPTPAGPGEPWAGRWKDHVGQRARPRTARGRSRPRPRPAGGRQRGLRAAGDAPPAVALRESGQGPAFWATCRARPVPSAPHGDPAGAGRAGGVSQSPLPRARGVGTRREQPPRPGRWFRNETHVHEPWPFPRHLRLLLVLVPLRRDPVGKPSPEPRGAGRPRAALVGRRAGRGRGVPTPDAPVRQSGPRPGRGLGRKSRSGEGHMAAPPRPSEGSVCGVGPVARDCPHSVHVCEAAPSVPGTRRPAHLELTCLA